MDDEDRHIDARGGVPCPFRAARAVEVGLEDRVGGCAEARRERGDAEVRFELTYGRLPQTIDLGDIGIVRDWCHASDMVRAMWEILRHPPGDWVVGTGQGRTIGELAGTACGLMGVDPQCVMSDPTLFRPNDPLKLVANPRKMLATGWTPVVSFGELLAEKLGKMPVVV